jgi:alpha-beta hydrolase superfamily lysophospholipase
MDAAARVRLPFSIVTASIFDSVEFNERLFFPRADRSRCPPGARDHFVSVSEGAALHVRVYDRPSPRATVLLFHGNGEVVADYDAIAARFHAIGFSLAVCDFRGYGRSTGRPTLRECIADAPRVLAALRDELAPGRTPWVVFGRSLGGHCAAEIAGRVPALCDAIVLESAGADPLALLARRGLSLARPLRDEERQTFDPRVKLARCALPTLVLHGANDTLILPDEARANFAAVASTDKRLVLIEGRGHNDVSLSARYWAALEWVI